MTDLFPELIGNQKVSPRQKTMTVKEVAESYDVDRSTITRIISAHPEIGVSVENGKETKITEAQATAIKKWIGTGRNDLCNIAQVENVTTDMEMEQRAMEVMAWQMRKIQDMRERLAIAEPKAEIADRIAQSSNLRTITEFGKIIDIGPRKIFDVLEDKEIIFKSHGRWTPFQPYCDQGYFVVRESVWIDGFGNTHTNPQTYITGKGEVWLTKKVLA